MSTTNRAFIKAYRQDAAERSPAGRTSPPLRAEQSLAARQVAVRASAAVGGVSHSNDALQQRAQKRPLSSFITGPPTRDAAVESDNSNFLQPGTIVASFQWPKICRSLSFECGPQLDRVIDALRAQADAGHSLIGVMGLFPRVGTTTAALCLAARASRRRPAEPAGRHIILVDGNFRHPRISSWLDAVPTVGWEEVLRHAAPLADAVIRATDDNLDVLALGAKASRDPQSVVGGLQAAVTAGVLRHAYDLAIIDLGPFFDPASQPIVLELTRNMGIDAVVMITGPERADERDLATIAEHFELSGCQLVGTIENRVAKPQAA